MADLEKKVQEWTKTKEFLTLTILKSGKERQTMWGTILSASKSSLLFYNEDEKKVYSVEFPEIEEIRSARNADKKHEEKKTAPQTKQEILSLVEQCKEEELKVLLPLLQYLVYQGKK